MPTITATVTDATGAPDDAPWVFQGELREGSTENSIVTPRRAYVRPFQGELSVDLEPGPVLVSHHPSHWVIEVPDEDADLWDLISAATE